MKMIGLLLMMISFQVSAVSLETVWTMSSEKELHLYCAQTEDETCLQFCGDESCIVSEPVCKNCVGTSVTMTYIFKEMGRVYIAGEKLDDYYLYDLLNNQNFVSLTSRSVYNLVYSFNASSLRRQFRSLCNDGTAYPVAFFSKNAAGEISRPDALWCESGVFELKQLDELPLGRIAGESELY